MANFTSAMSAIASTFSTQMASLEPTVDIAWDNGPKLDPAPNAQTDEWVRFSFRPAGDLPVAIGGTLWRGTGVAMVQVFTPLGNGQGPNMDILRNVQTIFRDNAISGVRVEGFNFVENGPTDDGWYQGTCWVRFETDENT